MELLEVNITTTATVAVYNIDKFNAIMDTMSIWSIKTLPTIRLVEFLDDVYLTHNQEIVLPTWIHQFDYVNFVSVVGF